MNQKFTVSVSIPSNTIGKCFILKIDFVELGAVRMCPQPIIQWNAFYKYLRVQFSGIGNLLLFPRYLYVYCRNLKRIYIYLDFF